MAAETAVQSVGGGDPVLRALYNRMVIEPEKSSLVSDYVKGLDMDDEMRRQRYELTIETVRQGSLLGVRAKQTPRSPVFAEQLRLLEEKTKADLSVLEDMQEFTRARAKLEMEHAHAVQRLAQQYHAKRKWPPLTFAKGHDSILLIDMWRSTLSLTMEDARAMGTASERLTALSGETFDLQMQQKRANSRTAQRVLERLQDELFELDAQVAETKDRYDSALKQFGKMRAASKRRAPSEAELRKTEASCEFARHQYLLEIAAANVQYTKFRNEQLPEVMDAATHPDIQFAARFLKTYTALLGSASLETVNNLHKVDALSALMSPEVERRTFLHEVRQKFPGRQLFERGSAKDSKSKTHFSHALTVDGPGSRHTLVKLRGLLMHTCRTIDANQIEREKQMVSLQSLLTNYMAAGSMFDEQQPKIVKAKMAKLHSEIEAAALSKTHLEAKVQRLTEADIHDDTTQAFPKQVLDLDEAQVRESERRALSVKSPSENKIPRRSSGWSLVRGGSGGKKDRASSKSDGNIATKDSASGSRRGSKGKKNHSKSDSRVGDSENVPPSELLPRRALEEAPQCQIYENAQVTATSGSTHDEPLRRVAAEAPVTPCPQPMPRPREKTSAGKGTAPIPDGNKSPVTDNVATVEEEMKAPPVIMRRRQPPVSTTSTAADAEGNTAAIGAVTDETAAALDAMALPAPLPTGEAGARKRRARPLSTLVSPPPPPPTPPPEAGDDDVLANLPPPPPEILDHAAFVHAPPRNRRSWALSGPVGESIYEEVLQAPLPPIYRALYPYTASQDDDITLEAGECVHVLVVRDDGWSLGIKFNGEVGYFPASYVEKTEGHTSDGPSLKMVCVAADAKRGFGFTLTGHHPPRVDIVSRGSAAATSGLRPGDLVLEFGGEPCVDMDATFLAHKLSSLAAADGLARLCIMRLAADAQ
mmetsp:Transcript_742/g.2424  ORF Transcript_742/g.2424 Transcript_742/m.2424 type:complete len:931 (-) Transcript_742:4392-7184(-)